MSAGEAPVTLAEISTEKDARVHLNIGELDRVLGGGIVAGSLTLVGGDPGIGKSTLLLQVQKSCACREKGSYIYLVKSLFARLSFGQCV